MSKPELKHLRMASDAVLAYPADVARLRNALNRCGFDAEPCDVERAWQAWSRDDHGVDWRPLPADASCADLVAILLRELEEAPPRAPEYAPATLAPVNPRVARGALPPEQVAVVSALETAIRLGRRTPGLADLAEAAGYGRGQLRAIRHLLDELHAAGFVHRIGGRGPVAVRLAYHVAGPGQEVASA